MLLMHFPVMLLLLLLLILLTFPFKTAAARRAEPVWSAVICASDSGGDINLPQLPIP